MMTNDSAVSVGLWSEEVAIGINASDGAYPLNDSIRTHGTSALNGTNRNPQNLPADSSPNPKQLAGWINLTVDCRRTTPYLKIWTGINGTKHETHGLQTFQSCNHHLRGMKNIYGDSSQGLPLSSLSGFHNDNQFKGGLQLYYAMDDLNNRNVYFRVINMNGGIDSNKSIRDNGASVIFDSKVLNPPVFFPDTFFKNTNGNIDYTTGGKEKQANKIKSQMPFNIIAGALKVNDGWESITAPYITKESNKPLTFGTFVVGAADKVDGDFSNIATTNATTTTASGLTVNYSVVASKIVENSIVLNTDGVSSGYFVGDVITISSAGTQNTVFTIATTNQKPLPACILKYQLEGSSEISRYLGLHTKLDISKGAVQFLHPNTGDAMNPNILHLTGMNLDWRNESYSIMINELPIKNYKNTDKMRNGGYSKSILANCPVPFSDSQTYQTKSKQMVTSTYKPNYQIINNLYNQQLTTNSFTIEIRKLSSDKPATEIIKSVINFTIVPPDSFKGNLNSISSLGN